jgi:hypothetical protein
MTTNQPIVGHQSRDSLLEGFGATRLLLLGMSAIKLSGIDINYHIDESFEGKCSPLKFKEELKSTGETHSRAETYYYKVSQVTQLLVTSIAIQRCMMNATISF